MVEARQYRNQAFSSSIFGPAQTSSPSPMRSRAATERNNLSSTVFDFAKEVKSQNKTRANKESFRSTSPAGMSMPKVHPVDVRTRAIPTYRSEIFSPAPEINRSVSPSPSVVPKNSKQNVQRSKSADLSAQDFVAHSRQSDLLASDVTVLSNQISPPKKYDSQKRERKQVTFFQKTQQSEESNQVSKKPMEENDFRRVKVDLNNEPASETMARRASRNFSNLFGREVSPKPVHRPLPEPPKKKPETAAERKLEEQSSRIGKPVARAVTPPPDIGSRPAKINPNMTARERKNEQMHPSSAGRRNTKAVVESFELSGLAPSDTATAIKSRLKGMHVVSIQTEQDSIQGTCTGKAKIELRHYPTQQEVQKFRHDMKNLGYEVAKRAGPGKRPSAGHAKNLSSSSSDPSVAKNLEQRSDPKLFGNSKRFQVVMPEKDIAAENKALQSAREWKTTHSQSRSRSPNFGTVKPADAAAGFLKSTAASRAQRQTKK